MLEALALDPSALIAPGVTAGDCLQRCRRLAQANGKWRTDLQDDWAKAVDAFDSRLRPRFLDPIKKLLPLQFAGFAVVVLDCLLAETIQSFRMGRSSKPQETAEYFRRFVSESESELLKGAFATNGRLKDFHDNVRSALAHDGETRANWLIQSRPQETWVVNITAKGIALNRDAFHRALDGDFRSYVLKLRDPNPKHDEARALFLRRLTALCRGERAT